MINLFTEVVIAPDLTEAAKRVFRKKKNIRLVTFKKDKPTNLTDDDIRSVAGGFLVQSQDDLIVSLNDISVVTEQQPSESEYRDLIFAWKVAKHVKSNAIVYAKNGRTVGIGAGQMSRVDSTRIAALKFQDTKQSKEKDTFRESDLVLASDAFFPFPDGLITAVNAGVSAVIQPGGSLRDEEIIQTANKLGISMVFTGRRHFRH